MGQHPRTRLHRPHEHTISAANLHDIPTETRWQLEYPNDAVADARRIHTRGESRDEARVERVECMGGVRCCRNVAGVVVGDGCHI